MSSRPADPAAAPVSARARDDVKTRGARRRLGEFVLHAPQTLRALVRADEIWLVVLAAAVGVASGMCVYAMSLVTNIGHEYLFNLQFGDPPLRLRRSGADPRRGRAGDRRPAGRADRAGDFALVERPHGGPDRSQRAVWRAHVAWRQPAGDGADGAVPTGLAPRSGWKPATPRSAPPWRPGSAVRSASVETICAYWSAAAPRAASPRRSRRR